MISVEEAKRRVVENSRPLSDFETVPLERSISRVLCESLTAPVDVPPFRQSSVDGYGFSYKPERGMSWRIVAEIRAGDSVDLQLNLNEAVRIFTGARVPDSVSSVVMQESIARKDDEIELTAGEFVTDTIREQGAQIKKGQHALSKGLLIDPAAVGFIASLGYRELRVSRKPRVSLIISGDELQSPGTPLQPGKVFDSNSYSLLAALNANGITSTEVTHVGDSVSLLCDAFNKAASQNDVVLFTGGVSVGDYDYVKTALSDEDTEILFHGVAQKPGKPLLFAKKGRTIVFGLPGNPASALTCFYEYVTPCLRILEGRSDIFLENETLPLTKSVSKNCRLGCFLKALRTPTDITPLDGQPSYNLKSFAGANALIYVPAGRSEFAEGELVEVHRL